jgi:hypothetical protein
MNDIKKKIGSRLKEIREQMKYTQEEIAAMILPPNIMEKSSAETSLFL